MTLYLVRHAMPEVDPQTDPATWPLGADGLAAARQLAARLPAHALLVASDEPKAWQTLNPDRERVVRRDRRLGEVRRAEEFTDDFAQQRRAYVCGTVIDGWESQAEVAGRFSAAVDKARQVASGRDIVVASHGMAMTVWLCQAISLPDPGSFWAELRFPDLLIVDLQARSVVRPAASPPTR
jgi:broad specificity phosphatase PhoE